MSKVNNAPAPSMSKLGFRMPAEWEPHAATWLAWPRNAETWLDQLDTMPSVWTAMVQALCPHELVNILVNDEKTRAQARDCLARGGVDLDNVRFQLIPTNDAWIRDHGPTFVEGPEGEPVVIDWRYNAWGGKYPPWDDDDKVRVRVAELLGLRHHSPGLFLEGGALDVNGQGTLLTNDHCVLNPNRNAGRGRGEVEDVLRDCLGVTHVLWLEGGLAGDETDSHIDILARFVAPDTVLAMVEEDPRDDNYQPLQDNYRRLKSMTDETGRPLRVLTLPLPRPLAYKHLRLPASYANFYIANGVVLVPIYHDPNDARALALLQELFPERRIVGIDCRALSVGGGAIHCVTQQQPARNAPRREQWNQ